MGEIVAVPDNAEMMPDGTIGLGALAGPSVPRPKEVFDQQETREIQSFGVEFFEYRRRLFLAGLPLPEPTSSSTSTISIPVQYPDPMPYIPRVPSPNSAIGRLELLLEDDGAEETEMAWRNGVGGVHDHLTNKRKFTKPIRLGLIIKILRAGWIREGVWPIDPKSHKAIKPPDDTPPQSPIFTPNPQLPHQGDKGSINVGSSQIGSPVPDGYLSPEQRAMALDLDDGDVFDEDIVGKTDLHVGGDVYRGGKDGFVKPGRLTGSNALN